MTCPSCRSENEMVFSALAQTFICQEADCGIEIGLELHDIEVLLHPDEELVFA